MRSLELCVYLSNNVSECRLAIKYNYVYFVSLNCIGFH